MVSVRHAVCHVGWCTSPAVTSYPSLSPPHEMSRILDEPSVDPIRGYFSQLCVMITGIATGVVHPPIEDRHWTLNYHMGRRDGYHVVVAHLASSRSLREAADKCLAFGRGVEERVDSHPYGPEWSRGFVRATLEAADDIAMYAASGFVPPVDRARLRVARTAARHLSPLHGLLSPRTTAPDEQRSSREW